MRGTVSILKLDKRTQFIVLALRVLDEEYVMTENEVQSVIVTSRN